MVEKLMVRRVGECALFFFGLLVTPIVAQQPSSRSANQDIVWIWSNRCHGDHKLRIKIRLENKVLYNGTIAICRGSRNEEDGRAEFHFAGGYTFQGAHHTRSTESIEGNMWEAGGDPDDLILGIMFFRGKREEELLNTLHIARPDKETTSELDKGLFITTDPVPVR